MATEHDSQSDALAACHRDMRTAGAALVERAKKANALRQDVALSEVFQLVNAVAWASEQSGNTPTHSNRLLTLVLEGLRPR